MQELYIIVAEKDVKEESELGIASGVRAYRKILNIKQKYPFRNVDADPERAPADLPNARD